MKVVLFIFAAGVALTGCAAIERSQARGTEQLLAAAGFRAQLADTAEQQQQLAATPAYRLLNRTKSDGVEYTYADPTNCKCLYVGGAKEYAEYQRLMTEQRMARERLLDEAEARDWGRWGASWFWR